MCCLRGELKGIERGYGIEKLGDWKAVAVAGRERNAGHVPAGDISGVGEEAVWCSRMTRRASGGWQCFEAWESGGRRK